MPTFIVRIPVEVYTPMALQPSLTNVRVPRAYHTHLDVSVDASNEQEAVAVLASDLAMAGVGADGRLVFRRVPDDEIDPNLTVDISAEDMDSIYLQPPAVPKRPPVPVTPPPPQTAWSRLMNED